MVSGYFRQTLSFLGIVLLSFLTLTTGARRPYLHRVGPAAHTSKASKMTEVRHEALPGLQPANDTAVAPARPSTKFSFPILDTCIPKSPGLFRVHTLRSPPTI